MKAMILAAGLGTRLQPLTLCQPKPLIKVAGDMLIAHHLRALAAAHIKDIVINVYYLAEKIQNVLGDGSAYGVNIQYSVEERLLGTGGGIYNALEYLGPEPFILLSADIWHHYPLQQLPHTLKGLAHLVMVDNPPFHPKGDYHLKEGMLNLEQEPRLNYGGIAIIDPFLFNGTNLKTAELGPLLVKAIRAGQVSGEHYTGCWFNIGTQAELAAADAYYQQHYPGSIS